MSTKSPPTIPAELADRITRADYVCGSDETGYGSWAGPLLVVSVRVPRHWQGPPGLTDSKKLTPAKREALAERLIGDPQVMIRRVWYLAPEIDRVGVYRACIEAHQIVHEGTTGLHIADGNLDLGPHIVSLPKADLLIPAVSAASVIAKVARDREMTTLGAAHPGYGFPEHKGYGTPAHQEALTKLGPCKIHRRSYAPVQQALQAAEARAQADMMTEDW